VLRVLLAVLGVALLMLLVVGGLLVGLGMLAFRAGQHLLRRRAAAKPAGPVLEGEYRVVEPRAVPHGR
jgi:cytochrome bd-type quinol oxidase subunit 2